MEQRMFKDDYKAYIKKNLTSSQEMLKLYREPKIKLENERSICISGIEQPEDLEEKLMETPPCSDNDLQNALHIYKAYEGIPLLIAAQESFWAYVSHVNCHRYIKERWKDVLYPEKKPIIQSGDVIKHWFGVRRNAIGELWWCVKLTVVDGDNPFELTKALFDCKTDVRQNLLTSNPLFTNKETITSILEFYRDYPEVLEHGRSSRNRFITQSLNALGGVRILSTMTKESLKRELEKNYESIMSIKNEDDRENAIWK